MEQRLSQNSLIHIKGQIARKVQQPQLSSTVHIGISSATTNETRARYRQILTIVKVFRNS